MHLRSGFRRAALTLAAALVVTAAWAEATDIVRKKDGGLLRGTIEELDPKGSVTIVLSNGERRTVPMSEVEYAGPIQAQKGEGAKTKDASPGITVTTEEAVLELASTQKDVTFHVKTGETEVHGTAVVANGRGGTSIVGVSGTAASYTRLCTAPCRANLAGGSYTFALSINAGKPAPAPPLTIRGPAHLEGTYVSKQGTRTAGWVVAGGASVASVYLILTSSKTETKCSPGIFTAQPTCYEQTSLDTNKLILGAVVGTVGVLVGVLLAMTPDASIIRVVPGVATLRGQAEVASSTPSDDLRGATLAGSFLPLTGLSTVLHARLGEARVQEERDGPASPHEDRSPRVAEQLAHRTSKASSSRSDSIVASSDVTRFSMDPRASYSVVQAPHEAGHESLVIDESAPGAGSVSAGLCSRCGAPLAQAVVVGGVAVCRYCGLGEAAGDERDPAAPSPSPRRRLNVPMLAISGSVLLSALLFFVLMRGQAPAPAPIVAPAATSVTAGAPLAPAEPARAWKVTLRLARKGGDPGAFDEPRRVAVDKEGFFHVADRTGRIQRFDPSGALVSTILAQTTNEPHDAYSTGIKLIHGLAVGANGHLVTSIGYDLVVYDGTTGKQLRMIPHTYPKTCFGNVVFDQTGAMIVQSGCTEHRPSEILRMDEAGKVSATIKESASFLESSSAKLAVDGAGRLYTPHKYENHVIVLESNGKLVTRFGGRASGPDRTLGLFRSAAPGPLAFGDDRLFAVNWPDVDVFDLEGHPKGRVTDSDHGFPSSGVPRDLAVGPDGQLFIAYADEVVRLRGLERTPVTR